VDIAPSQRTEPDRAGPGKVCYTINMEMTLEPELHKFIEAEVNSGRYSSFEEVVQAGLILLKEREYCLADIRAKIFPWS
jgi:putative addiction module CopG family antidote